MCAFQSRGQGFYYIHDYSIDQQPRRENTNVIITVIEGSVSTKDLEYDLGVYIGQGWRCSARLIDKNKYFMRFPNTREVERALYVEYVTLKPCGAVVRFTP